MDVTEILSWCYLKVLFVTLTESQDDGSLSQVLATPAVNNVSISAVF